MEEDENYQWRVAQAAVLGLVIAVGGYFVSKRIIKRKNKSLPLPDDFDPSMVYETLMYQKPDEDPSTIVDFIRKAQTRDFDIDHSGRMGTMVNLAARLGKTNVVKALVEAGANIAMADPNGETPLHSAGRNGEVGCIEILCNAGSEIDAQNGNGWTTLHWTAANGRADCTQFLLERGAKLIKSTKLERTPLHCACQNGHGSCIELILEAFPDSIHDADANGDQPINMCANNGNVGCLEILLRYGADTEHRNKKGHSPLFLAIVRGNTELVRSLLQFDPDRQILELTHVIELIAKSNPLADLSREDFDDVSVVNGTVDISEERKQIKNVRQVLTVILQLQSMVEPVLSIHLEKTISSGLHIFQAQPADQLAENKRIFSFEINHLNWLLRLLVNQKKSWGNELISNAVVQLDQLWERLDEFLSGFSDLDNIHNAFSCNPEVFSAVAVFFSAYYQLSSSVRSNLQVGDETWNLDRRFIKLTLKHQYVVRELILADPTLLTGPFDFIMDWNCPLPELRPLVRILTFEEKNKWLRRKIATQKELYQASTVDVNILRSTILEDSCSSFLNTNPSNLRGKLTVNFDGEQGQGAGVEREWLASLSKELYNPNNALFRVCNDGNLQPNESSYINPDHHQYFRFAGRIVALAIYNEELLDVSFTQAFYKQILGLDLSYKDMEHINPEYYKNLNWILSNDIVELGLDLTFSVEADIFGELKQVELLPGGKEIVVDESNKETYVQLVTELRMKKSIQPQTDSFLQGFDDVIPLDFIRIFTETELGLLVSGVPKIDVADWKANSTMVGFVADDPEIVWFWEIVEEMSQEEKAMLLQFSTGSSRVPSGGFCNLRGVDSITLFSIVKGVVDDERLPTASTCFNAFKMPVYSSKAIMKEKLLSAITCGSYGFTFA